MAALESKGAQIIGAMFSDEKLKENIAPAGRETRKFIDSLDPRS